MWCQAKRVTVHTPARPASELGACKTNRGSWCIQRLASYIKFEFASALLLLLLHHFLPAGIR